MRDQSFAQPGDEVTEIGVDEIWTADRHQEADEAASARDQLACSAIGYISEFASGLCNALAGF